MATPQFIRELRKLVGTRPLWLCGATAVVTRSTAHGDEVLLVRRADNQQWAPVSGIVDPGEHPADAAIREVSEEAGIRAVVAHLAWVTVTDVVIYDNGDQTQYIDHVFRCHWVGGEPHPADGEATEAAFFPLDALPALRRDYAERIQVALTDTTTTRLD